MKSGPTRILVSGNPPPLAVHRASDLTSRSPVGTFFQLQFFFPGIALGKNFPPFLSFVDFLWLFWLAPFEKRKKTTKLLHEFALRMDSKGLFSRFQRERVGRSWIKLCHTQWGTYWWNSKQSQTTLSVCERYQWHACLTEFSFFNQLDPFGGLLILSISVS